VAEKDITEKMLESYNDVFADVMNGLLFQGRRQDQGTGAGRIQVLEEEPHQDCHIGN
jgi:hypothetical protein